MKRLQPQRLVQLMTLGLVLSASGSIFQATGAAAAPAQTIQSSAPQTQAAGNPCSPNGTTSGCRDWIQGNKKPPIRPKRSN